MTENTATTNHYDHPAVAAALAALRGPVATVVAQLERREATAHGRDAAHRSGQR